MPIERISDWNMCYIVVFLALMGRWLLLGRNHHGRARPFRTDGIFLSYYMRVNRFSKINTHPILVIIL